MSVTSLYRRTTAPPGAQAQNPYARFGFRCNPFPEKAGVIPDSEDPRSNGSIYVEQARIQEQHRFEELLIPRPGRSVLPMAFLMDEATGKGRGIGKTAFLNHQRRRILADLGEALTEGTHVLFAAHVFTPTGGNSRKFWQFARALIETLNEQEVLALLLWRLRVFSDLIPTAVLEQAGEPRETIGDDQWLIQHGVDVQHELNPTVTRVLLSAGVDPHLAEALVKSGHSAERFRHEFLRFQSDYRWRQHAVRWLSEDFLFAFRAGRFTRGLFFIDDFEKSILEQNSSERRSFVDGIRFTFLDGPTSAAATGFYSFLWGIHPYVQELLIGDWNAGGLERFCALGGDRARSYTLDFLPVRSEATVPLVLGYLNAARIDHAQSGSLQPFNAEAIADAAQLNGGLPGFLLQYLHFTVERAIHEGWPTIDAERIRETAATAQIAPVTGPGPGPLPPPDVNLQDQREE